MDARELKGMQIAATMPVRRDASGWIVPSQSGPGTYRVVPHPTTTYKVAQGIVPPPDGVQPWACNCPDFELRNRPCKHVIAVEYVVRRQTVDLDGSVVTEEIKVTYTQDWSAYNAAQCEEKERLLPMLADLCSTVPSPPRSGRGRPRLPRSDMAYAVVSKVYSGLSARRHDSDVRDAKARGLTASDPCYNSVLSYLADPEMTPVLERLVSLSALPLAGVEQDFAMDSTGFSTCNYVRWYDHKWGREQKRQEWVKLHAATGVRTNVITSVTVTPNTGKGTSDSSQFPALLNGTAENFTMREVSADKAYSSRAHLAAVEAVGATPFIPFRNTPTGHRNESSTLFGVGAIAPGPEASAWVRMYHYFAYQRDTFLSHYHRRSNVECTFSALKRKFGGSLRSKSYTGQVNEILAKVILHNLCVIISAIHELGLEAPQFGDPALAG
jgi:transposase